jgi:hypothetical protein
MWWMESSPEEDQQCSQEEGSAHQVTFSEVSLSRSFAISRNCSSAASRSSTISWAMILGTIYGKWLLTSLSLARTRADEEGTGEQWLLTPFSDCLSVVPDMLWSSRRARAEIMASSGTRAAEASDRATMPAQDLFEHDKQVEKGMGASQGGVL